MIYLKTQPPRSRHCPDNLTTDRWRKRLKSAPQTPVSAPGYLTACKPEAGLWGHYPLPADAVWPGDPGEAAVDMAERACPNSGRFFSEPNFA